MLFVYHSTVLLIFLLCSVQVKDYYELFFFYYAVTLLIIASHLGSGSAVVSTVSSSKEGPWLKSQLRPCCVEFACSSSGSHEYSSFLSQPKDVWVRLIGDS